MGVHSYWKELSIDTVHINIHLSFHERSPFNVFSFSVAVLYPLTLFCFYPGKFRLPQGSGTLNIYAEIYPEVGQGKWILKVDRFGTVDL